MLDTGVTEHDVEQNLDVPTVCLIDQLLGILQGAEQRVDVAVVADVVAEVRHRGTKDWGQPDGVDAQPLQIVQVLDDPPEVTDAVSRGVGEAARVDLVHHRPSPPLQGLSGGGL